MHREKERQNNAKKQLEDLSNNFEFFFASKKPNKIPSSYIGWKRRFYFGKDLTLGEFGCFNSHKLVLEKIVTKKLPMALIFEDDFILLDGFKESINNLMKCSYKWELVRLLSKPKLNKRMKKSVAHFDGNYKLVRLATAP
jgi:glycosyl transferase family 25